MALLLVPFLISFGVLSTMTTAKGFLERVLTSPERCQLATEIICRRCLVVERQCGRSAFGLNESLYATLSLDSDMSILFKSLTQNLDHEMVDGTLMVSIAPHTGTCIRIWKTLSSSSSTSTTPMNAQISVSATTVKVCSLRSWSELAMFSTSLSSSSSFWSSSSSPLSSSIL